MTSGLATLRLEPAVVTHASEDGNITRYPESHFLDLVVNNRSLRASVGEPARDLVTELNRPWLPAVPEAVSRLLGQRTSEDLASERVALLVCAVDGDLGCGQLTATLAVGDAEVSWSDFLWEDGNFDPRPVEHVHQPVVFDRAQYETTFAGAAESSSEHPLARAIVAAAADRGVDLPAASEFESVTGLGVRAQVLGRQVLVGRRRF